MKLVLSIAALVLIANTANAADQWCNGAAKSSMGTPYYPNGQYASSMGTPYYPNGQYSASMGTPYYPNGQYMKSMGTPYYPNGQYIVSMGTPYYPNGQYIKSMGTCYNENGSSMGTCPKITRVKTTGKGFSLRMDVPTEGEIIPRNIEITFPGSDYTTSLTVDFANGAISDISAVCADTSKPGQEIIDLFMSSSAKDQARAKQVICN